MKPVSLSCGPVRQVRHWGRSRHMAMTFACCELTRPPLGPILNPLVYRPSSRDWVRRATAGGLLIAAVVMTATGRSAGRKKEERIAERARLLSVPPHGLANSAEYVGAFLQDPPTLCFTGFESSRKFLLRGKHLDVKHTCAMRNCFTTSSVKRRDSPTNLA